MKGKREVGCAAVKLFPARAGDGGPREGKSTAFFSTFDVRSLSPYYFFRSRGGSNASTNYSRAKRKWLG